MATENTHQPKEAAMATLLLSATNVAIRIAKERGTLKVEKATGRFGDYWAISDDHGLIEVAMSEAEAEERVS